MRTTRTRRCPRRTRRRPIFGTEFMTEKLKITDLITRLTYYPSLTISRSVPAGLSVRSGLQPAGRLVFPVRALRQLRQQAAGGIFQERLRLVERLRLQVLRPCGKAAQFMASPRRSIVATKRVHGKGVAWHELRRFISQRLLRLTRAGPSGRVEQRYRLIGGASSSRTSRIGTQPVILQSIAHSRIAAAIRADHLTSSVVWR